MTPTRYPAPAKLNLFLHITGRRPDGYHCLQTLFQLLDYGDSLDFAVRSDGQITCHTSVIAPENNIILKAAHLLKQCSHTRLGADIWLEKRIPIGGGLGGGSSNAATTLVALNDLWQLQLPLSTLSRLGLSLGADVPVFVQGQTAWAEGIGEILTPVTLAERWYLVIHPACSVATAQIFNDPALIRRMPPITLADFLAGRSCNMCETVVCRHYPAVQLAIEWLKQYCPARLTGTGACLFADFAQVEQAQAVLAQLPAPWQGFVARGKNVSPLYASSMRVHFSE